MSIITLPSYLNNHNSKLYFSKYELNQILNCYSFGVSRGKWRDYSINFNTGEAKFYFYNHSSSYPEYALIKYKKNKKNKFLYKLKFGTNNNKEVENINDVLSYLKRKNIKIINKNI